MDRKMEELFRLPLVTEAMECFDEEDVYCTHGVDVVDSDDKFFCECSNQDTANYICETMNDIWQGHTHIKFDIPLPTRRLSPTLK